ncbi:probable serine/threonine-protein kinase PBL11 [Vitis vinifera]|uniref:non-specific serine/threonine protein kinase n=1 Tax=Vitis vinifera TaxID=29760 RepID=A0A438H7Y8_VITVI|nr:probable serine/threonine-protein kinase PBL11 [Vitis vinifera]RVW80628.1 putative serine/threonine-protein kinase PBL3 [Vitis vinifera]
MGNCLKKKKLEDPNRDDARPPTGVRISLQQKNSVPIQGRNSEAPMTVQGRNYTSIQKRNPTRKRRPRGKKHGPNTQRDRSLARAIKKEEVLHAYRPTQFSYNVLHAATNKFSNKNLIGRGGFGDVFKGWIHSCAKTPAKPNDGQAIAVKRLRNKQPQGHEAWQNELNFLTKISHQNLVKLIGYCCECEHKILVYEYMPKGSLDAHLSKERDTELTWGRRIKIAVGVARGLDHLHTVPRPIIHRDLKTSNVLLDADFNPKLSDFGLAKYGPHDHETHVSTRVLGTKGYVAPEYIGTGHLTLKSDVYSFGVVLLEILSGSSAVDRFSNGMLENLADHAKPYLSNKLRLPHVIDKRLGSNFSMEEAQELAEIILQCLNSDANSRPTMTEVLSSLEQLEQHRDSSKHNLRGLAAPQKVLPLNFHRDIKENPVS